MTYGKSKDLEFGVSYLIKFELTVRQQTSGCVLVCWLDNGGSVTKVRFSNVSNLKLQDGGAAFGRPWMLSVNDITERQLDKIKYEVDELENNDISFVCEEIETEAGQPLG